MAARERRAGRRVIASLAVQFLVNGFVYASLVARLPQIRDRVGISLATLGLALTASRDRSSAPNVSDR